MTLTERKSDGDDPAARIRGWACRGCMAGRLQTVNIPEQCIAISEAARHLRMIWSREQTNMRNVSQQSDAEGSLNRIETKTELKVDVRASLIRNGHFRPSGRWSMV